MTPIARALSSALLHFVWQGALVALACWLLLWTLRRRSAQSRYLVACAALATLVLLPILTTWTLYDHPAATRHGAIALAPLSNLPAVPAPPFDWLDAARAWAVPVWACGVLFFALRMTWGCAQVATLRRRGEPARVSIATLAGRLRVTRTVRVLLSAVAESPAVVGWLRPVILLPAAAIAGLTPEQLEAVLAHELAHIRRHDYLVNLLQMAVESLLFYHPAVWWISASIRHERELCCDDLAASICGGAVVYARALTALEKMRPAPALALGANTGSLLYRIRRLVLGDAECPPSRLSGVVAIALATVCFALSVSWAHAQQTPPPPPPVQQPDIPSPALQSNRATPEQLEAAQRKLAELQVLAARAQADLNRAQAGTLDELQQLQSRRDELDRRLESERTRIMALMETRAAYDLLRKAEELKAELAHNRQQTELERALTAAQLNAILTHNQQQLEAERARTRAQLAEFNAYNVQRMSVESRLKRILEDSGARITRIEFQNVSAQVAEQVRAQLPIREGDTVVLGIFNKIHAAVHDVNPYLRLYFERQGDDVVLRIEGNK